MPTDPDSLPGTRGSGYPPNPPQYPPNPPQYPGGDPPRWPTPRGPVQPPPPELRRQHESPASPDWQQRAYHPLPARQPYEAQPAEPARRHSPAGISLPHLPVAHVILVLGVLAIGLALSQVWGINANGTAVYIQDFTNARIQEQTKVDTGALALQTATFLFGAIAVLSAVLIFFNLVTLLLNKIIGVVGLSGCATLLFFPVLWGAALLLFVALLAAAGFAGVGYLSNLPVVRDHGLSIAEVAHHSIGFYAWCGGIVAVFVGMLGQLALRRR